MTRRDPFDDPEWLAYAQRAIGELVPMIEQSSVTVSLVPKGDTDIKFAVELGLSIMLDKPILLVVHPGTPVPAKLMRVADGIVEFDLTDLADKGDAVYKQIHEALNRILGVETG